MTVTNTASTADFIQLRVKCVSYYGTQIIIIYCNNKKDCEEAMKLYEQWGYICGWDNGLL